MHKLCIWTPTITHHQSAFHNAVVKDGRVDLEVRYFNKISKERLALGWEDKKCTKPFEQQVETLEDALRSLNDMNERIHIISGNGYGFTKELIEYCISQDLKWINWTERSGGGLFKLVGENTRVFKLLFPLYQRIYNRKFARQIERYALGTFVSGVKAEQDYLKKGVSRRKIKHLYYALEPLKKTNTVPNQMKNPKFKYHFIYVGSLSHWKGIDVLLKAYSKLDQNQWGLILVGKDTTNGEYHELVKKLNIENNVLFTGPIEFNKVNEYLSFADVFILPTRFDGWGAVLNEAASLGLPMISTDECGAAYHLIENEKNGYMVNAGSVGSLLNAMKKYIEQPETIHGHSKRSLTLFEKFTPDENVRRFISALESWNVYE